MSLFLKDHMAISSARDGPACTLEGPYYLFTGIGPESTQPKATSTILSVTSCICARWFKASMHPIIASLMFSMASSSVSPCEWQPGRAGQGRSQFADAIELYEIDNLVQTG